MGNACLSARSERIHPRPADLHAACAQRERLEHIRSTPDATVHQHGNRASHRIDDGGRRACDRREEAVAGVGGSDAVTGDEGNDIVVGGTGGDTIKSGGTAMIIATLAILAFMFWFYGFSGFVADLASPFVQRFVRKKRDSAVEYQPQLRFAL